MRIMTVKKNHNESSSHIDFNMIITLIISIISIIIAKEANTICTLQAKIAKNSDLPKFEIKKSYDVDGKYIKIKNTGGRCYNFESEVITFLECSQFIDESEDLGYRKIYIPLYENYFEEDFSYADAEQELMKKYLCTDEKNFIWNIWEKVDKYNEVNKNQELFVHEISCIKISYVDFMEEKEEEYYSIRNRYATLLNLESGSQAFLYYDFNQGDESLHWKTSDEISIEQILDKMDLIENNNRDKEDKDMDFIILILGILLGIILCLIIVRFYSKISKKQDRNNCILYYELKYLEKYLLDEQDRGNFNFTENAETKILECSNLTKDDIIYLLDLYNILINYRITYDLLRKKNRVVKKNENIFYKELKGKIFLTDKIGKDIPSYNRTYEDIICKLK